MMENVPTQGIQEFKVRDCEYGHYDSHNRVCAKSSHPKREGGQRPRIHNPIAHR